MGMVDLGTLGGSTSVASGISINGYICGWSQNSNGQVRPFVWDPSSGMVDCGTLGGTWGLAMGVNNIRQVVGSSSTSQGDLHAFLWDPDLGVMLISMIGYILLSVGNSRRQTTLLILDLSQELEFTVAKPAPFF